MARLLACTHALLAALAGTNVAHAAPAADNVKSLPGYGTPPARQWSGFLDASKAEEGTKLHYWFAEMEDADPDMHEAPVVLWLNGGPGSSSILGMLQEIGPLLINATGGLMRNPYAWTKQAHLLVLESPAGVGYSYCKGQEDRLSWAPPPGPMHRSKPPGCNNSDISTARAARAALQDFFRKFPEQRTAPFYITGESYAGVYVPTLAAEILKNAPEVNLKGIAVGDPCTDNAAQKQSMDMLWYAHKHGLVPDSDFDFLYNTCKFRHPVAMARGHWKREEGNRWSQVEGLPPREGGPLADQELEASCKVAHRRFLATTSRGISQGWANAYINELDLFTDAAALDWSIPGTLDYYTAQWMNLPEVREALHVEESPATKTSWPGPPEGWEYHSNYDACNNNAAPGTPSMINFYREIAPKLARTIVFNGDVDPCVSYEGTRVAIEKVGFSVLPGGEYRPWFYNHSAATAEVLKEKPSLFGPNLQLQDAGPQFGGQVVDYEHALSFATVHGSGHMVPQFRPQAGARLLNRLLTGEPFAPKIPTGEQFAAMSDKEFDTKVDEWTKDAQNTVLTQATFSIVV